jgi:hypothetical protein
MLALLKLLSVKDLFYAGLLIAFGWYTVHERNVEHVKDMAAIARTTAEANAAADKKIATLTETHATDVAAITGDLNAKLKVAADQHTSDAQRLRDADAYRRSRQNVASPGAGQGSSGQGIPSSSASSDELSSLEQVALSLADSLKVSSVTLGACITDRNSLVGKP